LKRVIVKDFNVRMLHHNVKVGRLIPMENIIKVVENKDGKVEFLYAYKTHFTTTDELERYTIEV